MAVSIRPLFDPRAERSLLEVNQQLCFQLAMSEQQYRDPKEKLSTVEAAANSLANQLQKYKKENNQKNDKKEDLVVSKMEWLSEKEKGSHFQMNTLEEQHWIISDNIQDTEYCEEIQVSSGAQPQRPIEVGEELKFKLKQLQEHFPEFQMQIVQSKALRIAHMKEFFRKEWFSEEKGSHLQKNTLEEQHWIISDNTLETKSLGKIQVRPAAQLQEPMKEVEELKVKLKLLREKFPEIHKKITKFKDIIAHKKEFFSFDLLPEKKKISHLQRNMPDDQNRTIANKFQLSDCDLPPDTQASTSTVHEASSTSDVANNTQKSKCPEKFQENFGAQLQGPIKKIEELKVKQKQLRESFPEIQKKLTQLKSRIRGHKDFFRCQVGWN